MAYGIQRPTVVKLLLDALDANDAYVIAGLLGGNMDDISSPSDTSEKQILCLITWAEKRGHEEKLIETAMQRNATNQDLKIAGPIVLRKLKKTRPWYSAPDPFETCIIGSDRAFVDRRELRQRLQQLMSDSGWHALVVNGEKKSGRSYTHELIAFVIGLTRDSRIAHVDLSEPEAGTGPGDLVRAIAFQLTLGNGEIPKQQEAASRWNRDLRDWLVGYIEDSERTCWVVIDHIDKARPSGDTMDLIWKLAAAARTRSRLRVVLLGCSEPITDPQVIALEEQIEPIGRAMVEEFFSDFIEHKGLPPDKELVRKATNMALANVPATGADRLEHLQEQVSAVARAIAEGKLAGAISGGEP